MVNTKRTPRLERYLDSFEAFKVKQSPTIFVEYRGALDEAALARAYRLLCERHPVLRAQIRSDERGDLLYVATDRNPSFVACQGDENTLRSMAFAEDWDPARGVAQLIAIRQPGGGFVAIRETVAIGDGTAKFARWDELWRLYNQVVQGHVIPPIATGSLPKSTVELLRDRFPLGSVSINNVKSARILNEPAQPLREATDAELLDCIKDDIFLSAQETSELIATARAQKTTIYALVGAIIVTAWQAQNAPGNQSPTAIATSVDLRNRLSPPVGATEATVMALQYTVRIPFYDKPNALTIARDLRSQLNSAILGQGFPLVRFADVAKGVVYINNMGLKPKVDLPDGICIIETGVLASHAEKIDRGLLGRHDMFTCDGQFQLHCAYPAEIFSEDGVTRLVGRIKDLLGDYISR